MKHFHLFGSVVSKRQNIFHVIYQAIVQLVCPALTLNTPVRHKSNFPRAAANGSYVGQKASPDFDRLIPHEQQRYYGVFQPIQDGAGISYRFFCSLPRQPAALFDCHRFSFQRRRTRKCSKSQRQRFTTKLKKNKQKKIRSIS